MKSSRARIFVAYAAFLIVATRPVFSDEPDTVNASRDLVARGDLSKEPDDPDASKSMRDAPLAIPLTSDDLHALASVFGEEDLFSSATNRTAARLQTAVNEQSDDADFLPPDDWSPTVDWNTVSNRNENVLRIAYAAKRGRQFSNDIPIRVEETNGIVVVRFPASTNTSPGKLRYGPSWVATVFLEPETLRVIRVVEDPN